MEKKTRVKRSYKVVKFPVYPRASLRTLTRKSIAQLPITVYNRCIGITVY